MPRGQRPPCCQPPRHRGASMAINVVRGWRSATRLGHRGARAGRDHAPAPGPGTPFAGQKTTPRNSGLPRHPGPVLACSAQLVHMRRRQTGAALRARSRSPTLGVPGALRGLQIGGSATPWPVHHHRLRPNRIQARTTQVPGEMPRPGNSMCTLPHRSRSASANPASSTTPRSCNFAPQRPAGPAGPGQGTGQTAAVCLGELPGSRCGTASNLPLAQGACRAPTPGVLLQAPRQPPPRPGPNSPRRRGRASESHPNAGAVSRRSARAAERFSNCPRRPARAAQQQPARPNPRSTPEQQARAPQRVCSWRARCRPVLTVCGAERTRICGFSGEGDGATGVYGRRRGEEQGGGSPCGPESVAGPAPRPRAALIACRSPAAPAARAANRLRQLAPGPPRWAAPG